MAKQLTKAARFEIRLDERDKELFRALCQKNNTTMAEVLQSYIKLSITNQKL